MSDSGKLFVGVRFYQDNGLSHKEYVYLTPFEHEIGEHVVVLVGNQEKVVIVAKTHIDIAGKVLSQTARLPTKWISRKADRHDTEWMSRPVAMPDAVVRGHVMEFKTSQDDWDQLALYSQMHGRGSRLNVNASESRKQLRKKLDAEEAAELMAKMIERADTIEKMMRLEDIACEDDKMHKMLKKYNKLVK